jgi:hypothetical protein
LLLLLLLLLLHVALFIAPCAALPCERSPLLRACAGAADTRSLLRAHRT